jgi:excisionase family DNA binding protein
MTEQDKSPYSTIEEVAKHFTVSISTIRSWVRNGDIPKNTYIKIGQTYRFVIPLIDEALIKNPGQSA